MIPATIRQNPTPDLAAEIKAIKTRVNAAQRQQIIDAAGIY